MSVVEFPKQRPLMWVCNCGCNSHRLYADGSVECVGCGNSSASPNGAGWVEERRSAPTLNDPEVNQIADYDDADLTRSIVTRKASNPNTVLIVIAEESSRVRVWSRADSDDQLAWMKKRLVDAADLLK